MYKTTKPEKPDMVSRTRQRLRKQLGAGIGEQIANLLQGNPGQRMQGLTQVRALVEAEKEESSPTRTLIKNGEKWLPRLIDCLNMKRMQAQFAHFSNKALLLANKQAVFICNDALWTVTNVLAIVDSGKTPELMSLLLERLELDKILVALLADSKECAVIRHGALWTLRNLSGDPSPEYVRRILNLFFWKGLTDLVNLKIQSFLKQKQPWKDGDDLENVCSLLFNLTRICGVLPARDLRMLTVVLSQLLHFLQPEWAPNNLANCCNALVRLTQDYATAQHILPLLEKYQTYMSLVCLVDWCGQAFVKSEGRSLSSENLFHKSLVLLTNLLGEDETKENDRMTRCLLGTTPLLYILESLLQILREAKEDKIIEQKKRLPDQDEKDKITKRQDQVIQCLTNISFSDDRYIEQIVEAKTLFQLILQLAREGNSDAWILLRNVAQWQNGQAKDKLLTAKQLVDLSKIKPLCEWDQETLTYVADCLRLVQTE